MAVDLTGQRAEVREAAADMFGGRLRHWRSAPRLAEPVAAKRLAVRRTSDRRARHARRHGGVRCRDAARRVRSHADWRRRRRGRSLGEPGSSRPDLTAITGDVRLDRAQVTLKELTYAQSEVTRLRVSDGVLTIESLDWRGPGSKIVGRGSVGFGGVTTPRSTSTPSLASSVRCCPAARPAVLQETSSSAAPPARPRPQTR